MIWIILACSDNKNLEDTSSVMEPSAEHNEDPFSELQSELEERKENASPIPVEGMDLANTTIVAGLFFSLTPVMSLQMMISQLGQENISCPTIEGTFPQDGPPTEDIIVTGNGCTDDMGIIYNGSFVYNAEGVTYNNYSINSPSEIDGCTLRSEAKFLGGYQMQLTNVNSIQYLLSLEGFEVLEDCSGTIEMNMMVQGDMTISSGDNPEVQIINGSGSLINEMSDTDFGMDIHTQDEVIDSTICETEPISGTNTITNGDDVYVFTFDGASDCDLEPTQMLSLNGGESIEVSGTSCSTMSNRAGFMTILFSILMLAIRRRHDRI